MSRQIGVYYESWVHDQAVVAKDHGLANVEKPVNMVYLSFAKPDCTYRRGSKNFSGTGLNFNAPFSVIAGAIKILQSRNVKVFLAVGGGSYWSEKKPFYGLNCFYLMTDLGCNGIDLDWEVGVDDDASPVLAIKSLKSLGEFEISFTCFSTGAYPKQHGSRWKGMNIAAIKTCGSFIDQVNVMCYDAGQDFKEIAAIKEYQKIYNGCINMGFEVGKQGWGNGMLYESEAVENLKFLSSIPYSGGFIWAYHKSGKPGISRSDLANLMDRMLNPFGGIMTDGKTVPVNPVGKLTGMYDNSTPTVQTCWPIGKTDSTGMYGKPLGKVKKRSENGGYIVMTCPHCDGETTVFY